MLVNQLHVLYLPALGLSLSRVTKLLLLSGCGEVLSFGERIGPVYEVEVEVVQLQVLESQLTSRHHIVSTMVSTPGTMDTQYY